MKYLVLFLAFTFWSWSTKSQTPQSVEYGCNNHTLLYLNTSNVWNSQYSDFSLFYYNTLRIGDIGSGYPTPTEAIVSFAVNLPRNVIITNAYLDLTSPYYDYKTFGMNLIPRGEMDFLVGGGFFDPYTFYVEFSMNEFARVNITNLVQDFYNTDFSSLPTIHRLSFYFPSWNGSFSASDNKNVIDELLLHIDYTLPSVTFTYDEAGNRIRRSLSVVRQKSMKLRIPFVGKTKELAKKTLETVEKYKVNVYPNPTQGNLKVTVDNYPSELKGTILIYDGSGRQVLSVPMQTTSKDLDVSQFANGTYIMNVQIGTETTKWKVIKN